MPFVITLSSAREGLSGVFEPARNRLHIASGRTPAAAGHYRRYELFAHARPQPVLARLGAGRTGACR